MLILRKKFIYKTQHFFHLPTHTHHTQKNQDIIEYRLQEKMAASTDRAADDSLYPIAVLIDELKNEDIQVSEGHFARIIQTWGHESLVTPGDTLQTYAMCTGSDGLSNDIVMKFWFLSHLDITSNDLINICMICMNGYTRERTIFGHWLIQFCHCFWRVCVCLKEFCSVHFIILWNLCLIVMGLLLFFSCVSTRLRNCQRSL